MKKKNICLVGFMGAGKSTIARQLSSALGYEVLSTDAMIVEQEGREISEIFKKEGEPYFRKVEKAMVRKVSALEKVIVDCGGGVVLDPENLSCLKQTGMVIYLSATPESIYERVKNHTHRPLLNVENPMQVICDLLDKRQAFYAQASYTIDTDNRNLNDICAEIISLFNHQTE